MIKVKIEYKNRRMETVGEDEFDFDIYCQKLSQDLTGLLSDIEIFFDNQSVENNIESDSFYKKVRHKIFDIAGSIKRLPNNIVISDDISKEHVKKATLANILGLFKDGE